MKCGPEPTKVERSIRRHMGEAHLPPRSTRVRCEHCHGLGSVVRFSGEFLRAQRLRYGLGLREIARAVGISAAYLSDIERGRRYTERQFGAIERAIHARNGTKRTISRPPAPQEK